MIIKYKKLFSDINPEVLMQLDDEMIIYESASTSEMKGRFSFVACKPYGRLELFLDRLVVTEGDEVRELRPGYEALERHIESKHEIDVPEALLHLPFVSGYMGYCTFDLIRHRYKQLQNIVDEARIPDCSLAMIESLYVFDHYNEELYIVVSNLFSEVDEQILLNRLQQMYDALSHLQLFTAEVKAPAKGEVTMNISDAAFMDEVCRYKELIKNGDCFQVVPSRIYRYEHHFQNQQRPLTIQLYKNLKRQNPSPYMYYMTLPDFTIIGASPENFIKREGHRITTNPIAGTIARGRTQEEDLQNENKLMHDTKELAEHRMLVDLGRNDLNQLAVPGSVIIPKLMTIERFEHVMHIVSIVEGRVEGQVSPLDIIIKMLPAGTVSGAPKLRAIQRIYECRPVQRGIYAGGIGYINCNHDLDFALTIRTMVVDETYVNVEAGCGVVYDSVPENELNETKIKAKSLLEVSP